MTLQNNYCITGYIHTWISNFLSMRKQRVDIDGGYYLRLDKCAFGRATGHSFRPTPLFALHQWPSSLSRHFIKGQTVRKWMCHVPHHQNWQRRPDPTTWPWHVHLPNDKTIGKIMKFNTDKCFTLNLLVPNPPTQLCNNILTTLIHSSVVILKQAITDPPLNTLNMELWSLRSIKSNQKNTLRRSVAKLKIPNAVQRRCFN